MLKHATASLGRHRGPGLVRSFICTLTVAAAALTGSRAGAVDEALDAVRFALQARQYDRAVQLAGAYQGGAADEALYLAARAHFLAERFDEAVEAADAVIAQDPQSPWYFKALYLKGDALTRQRKFEAAEAIFAKEATRILSAERKREIVGVIVRFADALAAEPDENDPGAPRPDYGKAYQLYSKALTMEIDAALRDELMYKRAYVIQQAENHGQAINDYLAYLREFDPQWTDAGAPPRKVREDDVIGRRRFDARYRIGKSYLATNQHQLARRTWEDLLTLRNRLAPGANAAAAMAKMRGDTTWQIVRTYQMPGTPSDELDRAIKAARDFLKQYPAHPYAVEAAWLIGETYRHHQRFDEAVAAFEAFAKGESYKLPDGDAAHVKSYRRGDSPAEFADKNVKLAVYMIGQIRFAQRRYDEAIEHWQQYIAAYPNGPHWADSQRAIITAEFTMAVDAVARKQYDEARQRFDAFLKKHPLDGRAAQILFTLGQITYAVTAEAEKAGQKQDINAENIALGYRKAIDEWQRLVSKYPNTEESSEALYRIGVIYEEKLGDLDKALETYRRLNWGSKASLAAARVTVMTKKHLELKTQRKYRTNEKAFVDLNLRNVEKLTVKQYYLDLEAYFRKTHGTGNVEDLDIALIAPDKQWDVDIQGYAKYRPFEQRVEIPFAQENQPAEQPGVCIINVSEDDLQATTLVVRSDLDLIMKTSRRQLLVYVQDMVAGKPAAGVDLLVSDGKQVFATGKTGEDGVFRRKLDELKDCSGVRVFASRGGNIASNMLDLSGLGFSSGLAAKGYIYTDRPAYQPGHTVYIKGIIRDVKDGQYIVPKDAVYLVSVTDSAGRLLRQEELKLNEFGTFNTQMALDDSTPLGNYHVTARLKDKEETAYSGYFQVQRYQLQKMQLSFDFDRVVYFRGERVTATIKAAYYWGEPVAKRQVRYATPDGRTAFGETDKDGKLTVTFDTTDMTVGAALQFQASLEGENVAARGAVYLAAVGFTAAVEPSRELVLAGEPFDVKVTTKTPDGKPVGKEMTLLVLRREVSKADPVITAVPWISMPAQPAGEVTVSEHKVATDEKTGEGTVQLKLDKGGYYVLRIAGQDRFENPVTAQSAVSVSDDEDETKLRFFAAADTLKVGQDVTARLHSRLGGGIALVTFEGEELIAYRLIDLKAGYNDIAFAVEHAHYPNFNIAAATMDGQEMRQAARPFVVQRQLNVVVKPAAKYVAPGQNAKVAITVTDQLGRPVKAELSLALVDEALYALYSENVANILSFFQEGAHRHAAFSSVATNGFKYDAQTRPVVKEFVEEGERVARTAAEHQEAEQAARQLRQSVDRLSAQTEALKDMAQQVQLGAIVTNGAAPQAGARLGYVDPNASPDVSNADHTLTTFGLAGVDADADAGGLGDAVLRQELPEAGFWAPVIVTDDKGEATVEVPMPANTTKWRLTARGVTVETLAGQATAEVITRKDFFVNVKAPAQLREGDKPRVLARLHNLTDYAGPVSLTLVVRAGDRVFARFTKQIDVQANEGGEVLFDAFETPATAGLEFEVTAQGGQHSDRLASRVSVQPWGVEFADHGGGTTSGNATVGVELPRGRKYTSRWLTVTVGPTLTQAVVDMAMQSGGQAMPRGMARSILSSYPIGTFTGNELLAAVAGLEYLKQRDARPTDYQRLEERVRSLVAGLVVTQHQSGGWTWYGDQDDWHVSSVSYWALVRAKAAGVKVHEQTLANAETYLKNKMSQISSTDYESRAVLIHALSASKSVDFTHVNALHRERNRLSAIALGYTALAFVNIERPELAAEVLAVLEGKARHQKRGEQDVAFWEGEGPHEWLNESVETTAVALLAYAAVKPASPIAAQAAAYLMDRRGCAGFTPAKARGPAVAALAAHFGKGKAAGDDYVLTVLVGDREVAKINAKDATGTRIIEVPADLLADGETLVHFRKEGAGEYAFAATLRGFSDDLKDPETLADPRINKRYYRHAPLEYDGKPIGATSTSPVRHLEIGQRTHVWVDFYYQYSHKGYLVVEEHLPAGAQLVQGSLRGSFQHVEYHGSRIVMYFPPNRSVNDLQYELVGYASGDYRVLPTTVRDTLNPAKMRLGPADDMTVLAPGRQSPDPYVMNDAERLALGTLYFNDGLYQEALQFLPPLFDRQTRYHERDVARMLLWVHTSPSFYDARRVVETFEVLRRRFPELTIPFDRILVVGKAYRDLGEHERAMLVFRATIDNSFINDSNVSAVLEDEGQLLASIDYQENLWRMYPDTPAVIGSYFALAQLMYEKAPLAHELAKSPRRVVPVVPGHAPAEPVNGANGANGANAANGGDRGDGKPTKTAMYRESLDMLNTFLAHYPQDPLADDAAFSICNVLLDMKAFEAVVKLSEVFRQRYDKSDFVTSFQYMTALGYFWQRDYDDALTAAKVVAEGDSRDRDFARYILGQVYHAEGKPADAITWYETVKTKYSDAQGAIDYFERKSIKVDEVTIVQPGKDVELKLSHRNIKEAALQVYKVDLMKLYLREKNLSNITSVNLAGISPQQVLSKQLGDGKDYVDKETTIGLNMKDEGAYLVICRGDDLFTSGLVLITPLEIEVQEDAASGQVRANVIDKVKGVRPAEVHVKAIGSADAQFKSGETDLRGVFVADNVRGKATVIARDAESRYAFYRGETWLGAPMNARPGQQQGGQAPEAPKPQLDYQDNLRMEQQKIQEGNYLKWDQMRRIQNKGVEVQQVK